MSRKNYALAVILILFGAFIGALVSSGIARAQSSSSKLPAAPAGVSKWEYLLVSGGDGEVNNQLKAAGATDWEVVGFTATPVEGTDKQKVFVLVRRPK